MGFENGHLLRVALRATNADKGQEAVTTLHYDLNDNNDLQPNSPQSLADKFRDDVLVPFRAMFKSEWQIQPVVVTQEIDPQNPAEPREQWSAGVAANGTRSVATDLLPTAVCILASLSTGLVGRSFRGRVFVPGSYGEADQADGSWLSGTLTGPAKTFMDAIPVEPDLAGPGSGAEAHWCVYSRTRRAQDLDPYAPAVVGYALSSQVRWLRSRQPGN